jgi:hypothetical protein
VTPDEQLLIQALRDQFAVNLGVNLLNDDLATNIAFSPLFVDAVEQLRSAQFISPIDERELSRIVADECIARLLHVNPYLEVTDTDVAALAAIYRSSYAMIRSGEPTISAIGGTPLPGASGVDRSVVSQATSRGSSWIVEDRFARLFAVLCRATTAYATD